MWGLSRDYIWTMWGSYRGLYTAYNGVKCSGVGMMSRAVLDLGLRAYLGMRLGTRCIHED